jgi:hypothetical protein
MLNRVLKRPQYNGSQLCVGSEKTKRLTRRDGINGMQQEAVLAQEPVLLLDED